MAIRVRYFASIRESMGRAEDVLPGDAPITASQVWFQASGGRALPANTLVAINMEYSRLDDVARDGDEVAFFPPVTGG